MKSFFNLIWFLVKSIGDKKMLAEEPRVVTPQPISIKEGEPLSKYENCYFNVLTWIDELKITADGRYLLSSDEKNVKIWDIEQNRVVKVYENIENLPLEEQTFLDSFCKYRDVSSEINFYSDDVQTMKLIDNDERWVHSFSYPEKYILGNGTYLSEAKEGFKRYMFFLDDERGEIFIKPVAYSFAPLPFDESQSSKYIFSKSYEESLKIWNREKENLSHLDIEHNEHISCVAISRDGKYMVSGACSCYSDRYSCLNLWDLEKGELIKSFKEAQDIFSVCFSYDGEYIVTGSGSACDQNSCYLQVWNREGLVYSIEDRDYIPIVSTFESVGISVDGNYIFSCSEEKEEKNVWNIGTIEDFKVLSGTVQGVRAITVSEDKRYIVSASQGNIVSVWDREKHQLIESFILNYESFLGIESLSISSDNRYIGLKIEEKVKLWDREEKILYVEHRLIKEMKMDNGYEDSQEHILVSKDDSTVQVRSAESGELL